MTIKFSINDAKAHILHLVLSHHVHSQVHGDSLAGRFNARLAVGITRAVGSMWCAYAFAILALISLPEAIRSHNSVIIVAWIAQTFLQLVLLPIIIVGQNVQAAVVDARAESDHKTLLAIHTLTSEVHEIAVQQTKILFWFKFMNQKMHPCPATYESFRGFAHRGRRAAPGECAGWVEALALV